MSRAEPLCAQERETISRELGRGNSVAVYCLATPAVVEYFLDVLACPGPLGSLDRLVRWSPAALQPAAGRRTCTAAVEDAWKTAIPQP